MAAYTSLDDTVLWRILNYRSDSTELGQDGEEPNMEPPVKKAKSAGKKGLEEARNILLQIQRREHHRFIHSVIFVKMPVSRSPAKET